jgi:carbon-monoxide dehydrogenase small subunit
MAEKLKIKLKVNGAWREVETRPDRILLDLLREELGLTGTKKGCEAGECGACTVIMNGRAVLSCLIPALKADGAEITTIEGLAREDRLHPLQQAFLEEGAVQCGYCTPGMLLAAKALLDENPAPSIEEVKRAISGNLCRCTGYTKIIRAIQSGAGAVRRDRPGEADPEKR